jgi:hypothetical protein
LACCVENIKKRNLVINDTLLAVRVCRMSTTAAASLASLFQGSLTFNSRVILVYKVALDQLDGQAGLSYTTAADYHQLILSKELRGGLVSCFAARTCAARRTFDAIAWICVYVNTANYCCELVAMRAGCYYYETGW